MTTSRSSVSRLAASGFVATGVGSIANVLFLFLSIRRFGTSGAGVIVVGLAVQVLLLRICDMGSMGALVRYLSISGTDGSGGRGDSSRRILRNALVPVAGISCVVGAMVVLAASPLARLINPTEASEMTVALRAIGAGAPVLVVYMSLVHSLKAFEAFWAFRRIERLLRPTLYLGAATALPASEPSDVIIWMQLLHIVCLVLAASALRRRLPQAGGPTEHVTPHEFWRYAIPQGLSGILDGTLAWADTVLISSMLSSSAAATYTAIARVLLIYSFSVDAAAEVGAPRFSSAFDRADLAGVEDTHRQLTRFQLGLVVPPALVLLVWLDELIELVDSSLTPGANAGRFILVGALLATAMGPAAILLLMSGRSTAILVGSSLALLADLGLNLALLPAIGVTGAGVAWAVALVVGSGWAYWQTRTLRGPRHPVRDVGHLGFSLPLAAASGIGWLLADDHSRPYLAVAFLIMAMALSTRSLVIDRRS